MSLLQMIKGPQVVDVFAPKPKKEKMGRRSNLKPFLDNVLPYEPNEERDAKVQDRLNQLTKYAQSLDT